VWLTCRLRGARFVIDWHNFGYTILALSLRGGERHPLVRVARVYERFFARLGDAHICVTAAMRDWLRQEWGVE
jgi:beta-1,4-mannosyltransferase